MPEALPPARAAASAGDDSIEEAEVLQASIKAGSAAQIVVAVIAVIGLVYLLKARHGNDAVLNPAGLRPGAIREPARPNRVSPEPWERYWLSR